MNWLLVFLLLLSVVKTFCFFAFTSEEDVERSSFFAKPPPADCPNQVCPKGFECRNGMCTLMYPSRHFQTKRCSSNGDCGFERYCEDGICRAFVNGPRFTPKPHCPQISCPRGYECRFGICMPIETQDPWFHRFDPAMKCKERHECPHRMSCTYGFCT